MIEHLTFKQIEEFRKQPEAVTFAKAWVREMKVFLANPDTAAAGDHDMTLMVWIKSHPGRALGVILNLLEIEEIDAEMHELMAMGPVTEIVEETGNDFTATLQCAIAVYPRFALFTKLLRENSKKAAWRRLNET